MRVGGARREHHYPSVLNSTVGVRQQRPYNTHAQRQREQPLAFIENRELFGDLVDDERFVDSYLQTLQRLHTDGAEDTLEWILHVCSE